MRLLLVKIMAMYSFTTFYRASYASVVLGVVILSICLSVRHTLCDYSKEPTSVIFISHKRAILVVFCCQRSQRNSIGVTPNGVTPNGGAKERWGRLKRRFSTNIWLYLTNGALSTYFAGECHKLLTVGGNVDHIHRRDLYSAPRPSRRNGFCCATQLC